MININMRCIEIALVNDNACQIHWININMRCIEMNTVNVMLETVSRLTLT